MTPSATPIATISPRSLTLAGDRRRRAPRPTASSRSRPRSRRSTGRPSGSRDVKATYNPMTRAQLAKLAPQFDWDRDARRSMGLARANTVIVRRAERDRGDRQADRQRAAADLEGLSDLPLHQRPCAIPAQGVRRRALRLLRQDARRRAGAARPLEARRRPASTTRSAKASARSTSSATTRRKATRQVHELVGDILAALKDKIEQQRAGWTSRPARRRWTSSRASIRASAIPQIYRLFVAGREPRRPVRQCHARRAVRLEPAAEALPEAGRPRPVGHAAADQQRLLRPDEEPDHLPGGDPSAALFRSQRRPGLQLRQHRRDHRPRDRPRLRRPGPAVRRRSASCATGGRPASAKAYTARTAELVEAISTATSRSPACTSRAS